MDNKKDTSPHILNTSSNLLGICFIAFIPIKILKLQKETLVDEFTNTAMILFMVSCILSFLSLRSRHQSRSDRLKIFRTFVFLQFAKSFHYHHANNV